MTHETHTSCFFAQWTNNTILSTGREKIQKKKIHAAETRYQTFLSPIVVKVCFSGTCMIVSVERHSQSS